MKYKVSLVSVFIISFILGGFFEKYLKPSVNSSEEKNISSIEEGEFLKKNSLIESEDLLAASSRNRKTKTIVPIQGAQTSDSFDGVSTIEETGSMSTSTNSRWWVNSGGRFIIDQGVGSTVIGELPVSDFWYKEYSQTNPVDTDGGVHPQNIFRLVERELWKNYYQQAYFKIAKINLSQSSNRNASNGILLFNRYQSGDNLYYTGVRVDGAVVIKKKYNGVYYTMAYKKIFAGTYNQQSSPNLLPMNTWIGLRSEVKDMPDGSVSITLYVDNGKTGNWSEAVSATDTPGVFGSAVISNSGYAGIRTDFMDVIMDDFSIKSI